MSSIHYGEPRDVGYSDNAAKYYQASKGGEVIVENWLDSKSPTIFAGKNQRDLFLFAACMAKNHNNQKSAIKGKKHNNIPLTAFRDKHKWIALTLGLSQENDISQLKNESNLYDIVEEYAEAGIMILKSIMDQEGLEFPKYLEKELKTILGIL